MFDHRSLHVFVILLAVAVTVGAAELRRPDTFSSIPDEQARSAALVREAGKVITHPRCVNCHPDGDRPLQGEIGNTYPHQPMVVRGAGGMGAPGMRCFTCHGNENFDPAGVPGHPLWHLAPIEMAWQGKSLADICEQIKDPQRNGGKSMRELVDHMAHDSLVGYGWHPGSGREAAPGTQKVFGDLIAAWVETGAACPGR